MPSNVAVDHPKQRLLFFVVDDIDDAKKNKLHDLINKLLLLRSWIISPPQFVSVIETDKIEDSNDFADSVGVEFEIYSAQSPVSLSKDVDLQHFNEVEYLVEALRGFSEQEKVDFEVELDDTYVGAIERGVVNPTLSIGFLGEWKKRLAFC